LASVANALLFQEHVDALHDGSMFYGMEKMSCRDWMIIARAMISLLQVLVRQRSKGAVEFCRLMGLDGFSEATPSAVGLPFEFLSPEERSRLLSFVWAIMQAGPARFVEAALSASLPISSIVLPAGRPVPVALTCIVSSLARHSAHTPRTHFELKPRDPSSVLRMWERLQRRIRRDGIR
jgi:hypothetical protein